MVGCLGVVQLGGLIPGYSVLRVKARKSFRFPVGSIKVWNKEHLVDLVVTLCHSRWSKRFNPLGVPTIKKLIIFYLLLINLAF